MDGQGWMGGDVCACGACIVDGKLIRIHQHQQSPFDRLALPAGNEARSQLRAPRNSLGLSPTPSPPACPPAARRYALVWGQSVKHRPQKVGKDHLLADEGEPGQARLRMGPAQLRWAQAGC